MGIFGKKSSPAQRTRRSASGGKSPVYSYYNNHESDAGSEQARKNQGRLVKAKELLHSLPGYFAVVVILGCVFYSFGLTANPKVVIVNDQEQGVQPFLRTAQTYQDAVADQLNKSVFNRTKLSINTAKVEESIKANLPEVGEVSITLPIIGRNPVVYLRIAEPAFVLQPESGQAFVVDEQGRAVVPSSELPELEHNLVRVDDKSGLPVEQGKNVLPTDQIAFLHEIKTQFEAVNLSVDHFTLPPEANSLRVYPSDQKYYIKFTFTGSAREQVGRYLAAHKKVTSQKYIDVRVNDRVYVR